MLFNSWTFWVFFLAVMGLYGVLAHRWQNRMLLVASYVFYGWWDWRFLSLMGFSTVVDFYAATIIDRNEDPVRRRRWMWVSVVVNLCLLGFFKYYNFFIDSAISALASMGVEAHAPTLTVILPVGISFYTFQTMSYVIDVYRRDLKAARSISEFALFVSFFPQLVAGPIERATNLLPQVQQPRRMTWEGWSEGAALIVVGLFKKVAVADLLAPMAQEAFSNPSQCTGSALLIGLYAFSIQIYADFSGYSDIARGLARMMGFNLMENFQQPYFSASITEFWRRWHISLSTWLRDYLYIPLGGNRGGPGMAYRNLFLTMLLGGLWHGANWTFVVWGALHGIYLAVHKRILSGVKPFDVPPKTNAKQWLSYLVKVVVTFHLVALTWIFFRAGSYQTGSFEIAYAYLKGLLTWPSSKALGTDAISFDADDINLFLGAFLTLMVLVDIPQYWKRSHTVILQWRKPLRIIGFLVLLVWVIMMRRTENVPFIYFQF
ncbi:MAG: MBOAT family protein [Planctomycetes bacterium]|nr:MBOAT family protein [Planctomycetota bacterium]